MAEDETETIETEAQQVEFELPPEIAAGFPEATEPEAKVEPEAQAEETKVEAEPEKSKPAKVVPIQALDAERKKRQEAQRESASLTDRVERARQEHAANVAKQRAAEEAARRPTTDYNGLTDLNEVAAKLRDEIRLETQGQVQTLNTQLLVTRVKWSEQYWKDRLPDYEERLEESGVKAALAFNVTTQQYADPFLAGVIYNADDPAMFAYEYASGKLGKQVEVKARQQGYEEGKREVVETVKRAVARPRGIASLPASSAGKTTFKLSDIGRMSDTQQAWIKKTKPDLWQQYMNS